MAMVVNSVPMIVSMVMETSTITRDAPLLRFLAAKCLSLMSSFCLLAFFAGSG